MTTTKKTGTAPATAEAKGSVDKPYEIQPGPTPTAPAPIMSASLGIRHDEPRITPLNRGPQTGEAAMSDAAFVGQFAQPEELTRFRREIVERRAKDSTTWIWQRCDNPRCRLVMKDKPGTPDGQICPKCNPPRTGTTRADLGHMREMDDDEVNDYLFEQAARDKAEEERLRRAAFYVRNADRGKAGLAASHVRGIYAAPEGRVRGAEGAGPGPRPGRHHLPEAAMTIEFEESKLIDLFKAAAGDGAEVTLHDNRKVFRLGQFGTILVNGTAVDQLADEERFRLAQDLRQAAKDAVVDPARNPMIKLRRMICRAWREPTRRPIHSDRRNPPGPFYCLLATPIKGLD